MRTTMDIDANITGMNFEKSVIEEMINKIISIKIDDNVVFEIDKNMPIKEDSEYGGYLAGKFLSRYRAYRPVYINVTATTDSIARKNGYIRGLQENGLELSPDDILDADLSIKGGYECVMQNKSVFMGKIALFAFNDLVGIGVINACHELGIRIGEDIQIVGMDAISIAKEISPRLTTIDIRLEELARIGCEMLRDSIESKDSPVRSEIIRPVLCLGETTADI